MQHKVTIADMEYDPATLTISKGDTVTWTNTDGMRHTATAPFPVPVKEPYKWNTGPMKKNESQSITFNDVAWQGKYGCIFHPNMEGEIKIKG